MLADGRWHRPSLLIPWRTSVARSDVRFSALLGGVNVSPASLSSKADLSRSFPARIRKESTLPPFIGSLDSSGGSSYALPGGSLPPGLPTAYAVTRSFGPGVFSVLETSPIVILTV